MFEIRKECGHRLIGGPAHLRMVFQHIIVRVPAIGVTRIDLDETDTSFDHSSSQQATLAKITGFLMIQAIQGLRLMGLTCQIDQFGSRSLHSISQFVGPDSRR